MPERLLNLTSADLNFLVKSLAFCCPHAPTEKNPQTRVINNENLDFWETSINNGQFYGLPITTTLPFWRIVNEVLPFTSPAKTELIPNEISKTPWRKISVWQYPLSDLEGDVLFLDLDLVITGNLDKFFSYKKGTYCVIENWTQIGKGIGNTSCFRFPVKKYSDLFKQFENNGFKIWKKFHIEQVYLSKFIKKQNYWPEQWCKSFKHSLLPKWPMRIWKSAVLPQETSVVAFTGKPDPDDVLKGVWPIKKNQF